MVATTRCSVSGPRATSHHLAGARSSARALTRPLRGGLGQRCSRAASTFDAAGVQPGFEGDDALSPDAAGLFGGPDEGLAGGMMPLLDDYGVGYDADLGFSREGEGQDSDPNSLGAPSIAPFLQGLDEQQLAALEAQVAYDYDVRQAHELDLAVNAALSIHHRHNEQSINRYTTSLEFSRVLQKLETQEALQGSEAVRPELHNLPSWVSANFVFDTYFDEWNATVAQHIQAAEDAQEGAAAQADTTLEYLDDALGRLYCSDGKKEKASAAEKDPLDEFLAPLASIPGLDIESTPSKEAPRNDALEDVLPGASTMEAESAEQEEQVEELELDF